MNCWLVIALPMRATGTLFCTATVSAGESNPMPAPETSAATKTHATPWATATMNTSSPRMCSMMPIIGKAFYDRCTNRPVPNANALQPMVNAPTTKRTIASQIQFWFPCSVFGLCRCRFLGAVTSVPRSVVPQRTHSRGPDSCSPLQ